MLLFANKAAVVDYAMCADLIQIINDLHNEGGGGGVTFSFHSAVCNKQIWNREKKRNIPAHVQPDAIQHLQRRDANHHGQSFRNTNGNVFSCTYKCLLEGLKAEMVSVCFW